MTDFIDIEDKNYPESLKKVNKPPKKIYYKGDIGLLKSVCFSVVGSRDVTNYGAYIERKFVNHIARRRATIVSGLAVGADSIAHEEALNVGGKTIAVLGGGFNHISPEKSIPLYERILKEGGLVISEYEDDCQALSENFPIRNRIIAGLSLGVLVVEAKFRSGSSITAKYAMKQGKKVFALPGRLDSVNGTGVNNLIKNGALLAASPSDIINEIPELKNSTRIMVKSTFIKREYRKIYNILNDIPMSLDEISIRTQNSVQATSNLLSLMELEDLIDEFPGARICQKISKVKINLKAHLAKI